MKLFPHFFCQADCISAFKKYVEQGDTLSSDFNVDCIFT